MLTCRLTAGITFPLTTRERVYETQGALEPRKLDKHSGLSTDNNLANNHAHVKSALVRAGCCEGAHLSHLCQFIEHLFVIVQKVPPDLLVQVSWSFHTCKELQEHLEVTSSTAALLECWLQCHQQVGDIMESMFHMALANVGDKALGDIGDITDASS